MQRWQLSGITHASWHVFYCCQQGGVDSGMSAVHNMHVPAVVVACQGRHLLRRRHPHRRHRHRPQATFRRREHGAGRTHACMMTGEKHEGASVSGSSRVEATYQRGCTSAYISRRQRPLAVLLSGTVGSTSTGSPTLRRHRKINGCEKVNRTRGA